MKIDGLKDRGLAVLLLLLTLTGCFHRQRGEAAANILHTDIRQVEVSFYSMGETRAWSLWGQEIEDWAEWLGGLTVEREEFPQGESPGDADGGECYTFRVNGGEAVFSYVMPGPDKRYILYDGGWYAVKNPIDPFADAREAGNY